MPSSFDLEHLLGAPDRLAIAAASPLAAALARAATAITRLDQALAEHPLRPAFLHRARLEAVRRQAAADGLSIDPWHLAALLEGLRLRMEGALRIADRGAIFEAGRYALTLYSWLITPDHGQAGEIQRAEAALTAEPGTPLLAAALAAHAWLEDGGARPPLRAALIRFWAHHGLLRTPVPLTGPRALAPDVPWQRKEWVPAFLNALADEADDGFNVLLTLERAWTAGRRAAGGRRRHSRAMAAVDMMAAVPLVSATSLAAGLDMTVKNAGLLLDRFRVAGIAVEVTHRSKRRLYGLTGLAPLRDAVAPPRRPEPGRRPGRPRLNDHSLPDVPIAPPAVPLPLRFEHPALDFGELEFWMTQAEQTVRVTRQKLDALLNVNSDTRTEN